MAILLYHKIEFVIFEKLNLSYHKIDFELSQNGQLIEKRRPKPQ